MTLAYISFKILTSMYLMVSYIISHLIYASTYSDRNSANKLTIKERADFENDFEKMRIAKCFGYNLPMPDVNHVSRKSDWPYYWIYFTNWSWTLLVASFFLDTSLVMLRFREQKQCTQRNLENNGIVTEPTHRGNIFLVVLRNI